MIWGFFPGTFKTKPFRLIFDFGVGFFSYYSFMLTWLTWEPFKILAFSFFPSSYCFDVTFNFCLLLSMNVWEDWKFYFFTYFCGAYIIFEGSYIFFSVFSLSILDGFRPNGFEVSLLN